MKHLLLTTIVVVLLAEAGFADAIHDAAFNGNIAVVRAELNKDVDVNNSMDTSEVRRMLVFLFSLSGCVMLWVLTYRRVNRKWDVADFDPSTNRLLFEKKPGAWPDNPDPPSATQIAKGCAKLILMAIMVIVGVIAVCIFALA